MAGSSKIPCDEQSRSPDVSPSTGLQATRHVPSPSMEREYEFFVTTEEPHQPEGVERGKIRRLVMRNFFDTKSAGPQTNSSEHSSASTVMAKKQLKSRFRLSSSGGNSKWVQSKRRELKEEESKEKGKRPQTSRKNPGASERSTLTNDARSTRDSPAKLQDVSDSLQDNTAESADRRLILKIDPSANRFDPFDVLPVPGTQQLDTLFKLCESNATVYFHSSHPV
jgi:hypothetical protein